MKPSAPAIPADRATQGRVRRRLFVFALACASAAQADQVTVDGRDFIPIFGNTPYGESSAGNLICMTGGGTNLFTTQLPLPPVELTLKQLAIWGGDFTDSDATVSLVRYCQTEFSPSVPTTTNITSVSSSGNGGNYFDSSTLNLDVDDQQTCIYMLQAQIGLDTCPGNTLSIARVRVRYDLVQAPVVDPIFKSSFEN